MVACNKVRSLAYATRVREFIASINRHFNRFLIDHLVSTTLSTRFVATTGLVHQVLLSEAHLPLSSQIALDSDQMESGKKGDVLCLLQHMPREGTKPSARMLIILLKACGSIPDLAQGRKLHEEARKNGFMSDIYVGNTLISMYGKCGAVEEAEDAFSTLPVRTIVSWNVMLAVYSRDYQGEKVLWAYRQMQVEGPSPDVRTFVLTLQACGALQKRQEAWLLGKQMTMQASFEIGQAFHSLVCKKGLAENSSICSSLVSLYGKCGAFAEAVATFDSISKRSLVSWTAMLSACAENNQGEMALLCYKRMQEEGFVPDQVTCVIGFQACSTMAEEEEGVALNERSIKVKAFKIGQALHEDACKLNVASDTHVGTSIISMYGKCGAVAEAEEAFQMLAYSDIVSWNAMISVYVEQGDREKVLFLYKQMQEHSLEVDLVTVIYALQACSEIGSLEVCEELHFHVICMDKGKPPSLTATLIHAYGNCCCMSGAEASFEEVVNPDMVSWSVLLSGYAGEGNDSKALRLFEGLSMTNISPDDGIFASVLTACGHAGLVVEGLKCFESMTRDYFTTPKLMHYGVMADLLGRVGEFNRVSDMLRKMPFQPDLPIWSFLLGACLTHSNVELAEEAFGYAIRLQPKQATAYILMSNVYATVGLHDRVKEVEAMRHKHGLHWLELD